MSGNFDDSPAPDSERADRIVRDILESSQTRHSISPSGELYRLIERYHDRHDLPPIRPPYSRPSYDAPRLPRLSQGSLPPRGPSQTMAEQEQDADLWGRISRDNERQSPFSASSQTQDSASDNLSARERMFNYRASRRGRMRPMFHSGRSGAARDEPSAASSLVDLQNAGRELEQASSTLRAHLDAPLPSLQYAPRSSTVPFDHLEAQEDSSGRRAKRRKIETDEVENKFNGFRYGKYGQSEAGKLKMEIVSCDGGIYQEGPYSADNVLRTDDTVYCTKSNRCNLVLRHQGATVFSLTELIIKAPHSGYTAPVQDGMVFVSMTSDDLLTRTARYQIQYSPPRSRTANGDRPGELAPIMSIRHNRDGSAQARAGRLYDIGVQDEECDTRTAQIPPDFTSIALPFLVTTECSDSEEEDSRPYRFGRTNADRYAAEYPHDSSEEEPSHHQDNYLMNEIRSHRSNHVPFSRRETASNITLAEAAEASQIATQEAIRAVGGELMVPHAKFFIERDKSKCTVRFDPPVSGRFILLKMWSPHHDPSENIDVQSVIAKGFAGPRFIPDVTLR